MPNPPLSRETDSGREYVNFLTGEAVPSITTVMKAMANPDIEAWKLRMAANHANLHWDEMSAWDPLQRKEAMTGAHEAYSGEKAALGTLVHEICESLIKGNPVAIPKEASSYVTQFGKFMMEKKPRFAESEFTVWNRGLEYAGTGDFLAEIGGKTVLVDIKTGKGVYSDYGLQLTALKNAEFLIREDCSEEPLPEVHQLALLHLRPRSWKLIPVRREKECFLAFTAARQLFSWTHEVADDVLGEAA